MASVVIVGGSEESRLLLRGLLRLYRHRVVADGPRFDALRAIPSGVAPSVAVVDIDLEDAQSAAEMAQAMRSLPSLHFLLLTSERGVRTEGRAKELGIERVVIRPFAVHDLMEAVEAVAQVGPPPTGPEQSS